MNRIRERCICILGLLARKCQLTGQAANISGPELLADQATATGHEAKITLAWLTLHEWKETEKPLLLMLFESFYTLFQDGY